MSTIYRIPSKFLRSRPYLAPRQVCLDIFRAQDFLKVAI